jgi:hypothetical protein
MEFQKHEGPAETGQAFIDGWIVRAGLKAVVGALAQGLFCLLAAGVIIALAAVRTAPVAPKADVVAGHAFTHLDFKVRAALDTAGLNVSNALTG